MGNEEIFYGDGRPRELIRMETRILLDHNQAMYHQVYDLYVRAVRERKDFLSSGFNRIRIFARMAKSRQIKACLGQMNLLMAGSEELSWGREQ